MHALCQKSLRVLGLSTGFWAAICFPGGGLSAQTSSSGQASIEQSRLFQNQPTLRSEESQPAAEGEKAPATEGDPDLGAQLLLKRNNEYDAFKITASSQVLFTDNVALVKKGAESDAYMVHSAGVQWKPKITETLYAVAGVRQGFFRYDEFDALDFDSLDAGAGLENTWQDLGGVTTSATYNYNRLTEATLGREFFRNHQFIFSADKSFTLSRNLFLFTNASATISLSDPYDSQRWDYALVGGLYGRITRHWDAQLTYRVALFDYSAQDRTDFNQNVGLNTSYNLAEWAAVGASTNFTFNNSSEPVFDYESINAGGGVYLNVKF
ncbi:MAG: hypothetical protein SFU85_05400 [Candidatus Methylacidiphilales bacterium]|nr:hypothetical protein [Candidatus Methylacidiphilales bacterium]